MYHSLIFQDGDRIINTWDDWHLIPSSRPVFEPAAPMFKYVDIPGRDGQLDITDYLIGRPTYSDRKGSFEFIVKNGYDDWTIRRTQMAEFLNGRKMKVFLEDEPDYYYLGRFVFKGWKSEKDFSHVTIEYQVEPYRYYITGERGGL